MNFGELLGAGLLGGVGNAAKGAGDRLREEAKQKREMALLNALEAFPKLFIFLCIIPRLLYISGEPGFISIALLKSAIDSSFWFLYA